MIDDITPVVATFNEAENIGRTLAKLSWARRIVVVDSGSTDATLAILAADPRVEVFYRAFDRFSAQWDFGLSHVRTEWCLTLDADYELTDALVAELAALAPDSTTAGYRASFIYRVNGRPLRGTLYPPRIVLFRVGLAHHVDEGHTQVVRVGGRIGDLSGRIYHDDRKPLSRWWASQQRYAEVEATYLLAADRRTLPRRDRLRLMAWPAPFLVFAYTLIAKGVILDGRAGWFYALQRLGAEIALALAITARRLAPVPGKGADQDG